MKVIKQNITVTQVIDKSEFIGILIRITDENDARQQLAQLRKQHSQATHVCYALITEQQTIQRSSDDGEPARTAGIPILEVLKKYDLNNILAVVVRYFGGIKLGAGGLIRAYSGTTAIACSQVQLATPKLVNRYLLEVPYPLNDKISNLLTELDVSIVSIEYQLNVRYIYLKDYPDLVSMILELSSGQVMPQKLDQIMIEE